MKQISLEKSIEHQKSVDIESYNLSEEERAHTKENETMRNYDNIQKFKF